MNESFDISIVIPLFNEEESLSELSEWIEKVMHEHNYSYEVIYVDDGSTDSSWSIIETLSKKNPAIKGIKFRRNYGKSAGLNVGFEAAQGNVVFTMDADLQDSPDELPEMYNMIVNDNYDLVSGWKKKRYDPLSKTIPTKLFNWATRKMSGINNLHDFNCGLKAYKKDVVKTIEVYGEMHRYIPVLAKWAGFSKITEKVVQHRERKYGVTKFGLERFINGFLDLLSITFIAKFGKRPMHLFGSLGTITFFIGFLSAFYIGIMKLYRLNKGVDSILVTDNPYFYISLTCMILGSLLFVSGFLGELISRNSSHRNTYHIEKKI
ncbi:MAG: glycosyltransferase family 2 protein [Flavobacteriales bacterium]|nr:glycosyltransferase family 2 protein [Flavobacteriales bacterium]MCB9174819.1 glycosyltransferase family 2 protein [Flavobacteriales bacterium]